MTSFRSIIDQWPDLPTFADDLGVRYGAAQVMRHRDSISSLYWRDLVAAAEKRGIQGVTLELLANLKAERRASAKEAPTG